MVSDTNQSKGFDIQKLLEGISLGSGIIGNQFATPPGNSNIDTSQWTSQDVNRFIQNLINTTQDSQMASSAASSSQSLGTSTPNLSPQTQQFLDQLIKRYSQQAQPVNMQGLEAGGIQGINRNADLQQQAVQNIMAARGLSTSPVSGTAAGSVDNQRFQAINQFQQSLPLMQNQMNLQNLNAAGGFFNQIPYGTTQTGAQSGTSSGLQATHATSEQQSTQGETVQSSGTQRGTQVTKVPEQSKLTKILGVAGGLGSIAASLFSDKRLKKDITPLDKATDMIRRLKPVQYEWKRDVGQGRLGFLAQDIEKLLPELVHTDSESGYKKVDYSGLIPILVGAVQELNSRVGD